MYFIVQSDKTFEQAASDLDAAVKRNGFGVLHVHDLGATLRGAPLSVAVMDWSRACPVIADILVH